MAIEGRDRGAAIEINDAILLPADIAQYQAGPVTYRSMLIAGRRWLGVFEAQHDGTGWLVVKTMRRPLVLMPDDFVHVRMKVVEDHGNAVYVEFNDPNRGRTERSVSHKDIVFLEEKPGPITTERDR